MAHLTGLCLEGLGGDRKSSEKCGPTAQFPCRLLESIIDSCVYHSRSFMSLGSHDPNLTMLWSCVWLDLAHKMCTLFNHSKVHKGTCEQVQEEHQMVTDALFWVRGYSLGICGLSAYIIKWRSGSVQYTMGTSIRKINIKNAGKYHKKSYTMAPVITWRLEKFIGSTNTYWVLVYRYIMLCE